MKHLQHSPAMEAIEYQSGAFFKEVVLAIRPFMNNRALKRNEIQTLCGDLEKICNRHTGGTYEFNIDGQHPTCIYVPDINVNHVLNGNWWGFFEGEDALKILRKSKGTSSGMVNLEKSKLTGFFAELKPRIFIGAQDFYAYGATAEEIAAAVLHECGHFFTYCEMIDRTVSTNQILAGLDRGLRSGEDIKTKEIIVTTAIDKLGLDKNIAEEVKKARSVDIAITVVATAALQEQRTQNKSIFYDHNTFEMMSDQFAVRHGAGPHITTYLDKIFRIYGDDIMQSSFTFNMLQVFRAAIGIVGVIAGVASGAGIVAFLAGIYLLLQLGDVGSIHEPNYDNPLQRAMRVRRQLIEHVKQFPGNKDIVNSVARDVAVIDKTVKDYQEKNTWAHHVWMVLSSSYRSRVNIRQFQMDLEALAINDLFLISSELKHA